MSIIIKELFSKELNLIKKIRIYLPKNYLFSTQKYPVLYMHDGQNIFSTSNEHPFNQSWNLEQILENFENQHMKIIIVGIDCNTYNFERFNEYSPWKNSIDNLILEKRRFKKDIGGKGDLYAQFLINSIKPFIDSNFRTFSDYNNTFIAGSSMGAIISLYIALEFENIFSKVGLFSIATWFAESEIINFINKKTIPKNMKFYLDIGTNESSCQEITNFPKIYLDGFKKVNNILSLKTSEKNIFSLIEPFGEHNEFSWSRRFPIFLHFILNNKKKRSF